MADKSQKEKRNMRKAAELYHRGLEFMQNENHKAAFECYTSSLQHHPTEEAFVSRAAANLREKRYSHALADANEALKMNANLEAAMKLKTLALGLMNCKDGLDAFLQNLPGNSANNAQLLRELNELIDIIPKMEPKPEGISYKDSFFELGIIGGEYHAKHPGSSPFALAKFSKKLLNGTVPEGLCGFQTLEDTLEELNKVANGGGVLFKIKLIQVSIDANFVQFFRSLHLKQRKGITLSVIQCKCSVEIFEQIFDGKCLTPFALLLDGLEGIKNLNMSEAMKKLPALQKVKILHFNEAFLMSDHFRQDRNMRPIFEDIQPAIDWLHTPWKPPRKGKYPAIDMQRKLMKKDDNGMTGKLLGLDSIKLGMPVQKLILHCSMRFMEENKKSAIDNGPTCPYIFEVHSRHAPDLSMFKANQIMMFAGLKTSETLMVQVMPSVVMYANGQPKFWVTKIWRRFSQKIADRKKKEQRQMNYRNLLLFAGICGAVISAFLYFWMK